MSKFSTSDHEFTGVQRPGLGERVDLRVIVSNVKAEEVLMLHKRLIGLKVGTNRVEREAANIKAERFNKERVICNVNFNHDLDSNVEETNVGKDGTDCKRDCDLVKELMVINAKECRLHRNKVRRLAREQKKRLEAKARELGSERLKHVQRVIKEEVTKVRKELRVTYSKKIENLVRRSKNCKYHKVCKSERERDEEEKKKKWEEEKKKKWDDRLVEEEEAAVGTIHSTHVTCEDLGPDVEEEERERVRAKPPELPEAPKETPSQTVHVTDQDRMRGVAQRKDQPPDPTVRNQCEGGGSR